MNGQQTHSDLLVIGLSLMQASSSAFPDGQGLLLEDMVLTRSEIFVSKIPSLCLRVYTGMKRHM